MSPKRPEDEEMDEMDGQEEQQEEVVVQGALASQPCFPWTTTSSCCSSWPSISSISSSGRLGLILAPFLKIRKV